ncbi:MAG TPA: TonB-dependent receptor [Vicinamibacterales bacterium]|nr:TonB-dependent receptor [Vicinamibacterales bacterium]
MIPALLLALAQFSASYTGELRVTVTDAAGLPVARAAIEVSSDGVHVRERADTDETGVATVRRLPYGTYRVTASSAGFAASTVTVEIRSAVPAEARIGLTIAPVQASVTVAADTFLDPHQAGAIQRIGRERIEERPAATASRALVDLVNAEPGWLLEANGVLHPRGSEYDTQYVIDGLPLTDNRSPAFAPPLGAESVRSFAILTGGYPAEYGRKLGGVVEVVTDAGGRRGAHGSAALTVGSFATREAEGAAGYATDAQTVQVSAGASSTNRFLDPPVERNFTNRGTSSRASTRWEADVAGADRIGLIARHGRLDFQVPNELVQQAAGQEQTRTGRETAAQFSYRSILSPRAVAEVVGMGRRVSAGLESNALATPLIVDQSRSLTNGYVKATVALNHGVHELKAGADADLARAREALAYAITDPDRFDDGTPRTFDFADEATGSEQAFFVQDQIRSGPWTLNAGLRWDRYRFLVHESAWSPRLAAARAFDARGLLVRASYDRIFQTPAVENLLLASSAETADLSDEAVRLPVRPSRGHFVEAGLSKALRGRGRLDASYFMRRLDNFADDDLLLNTGVSFPMAFRRARINGAELKLEVREGARWSGSLAYAYMRATGEFPVTGGLLLEDDDAGTEGQAFPISQDQRHTLRGRLRLALPRSWIAVSASFGSGLPFEEADSLEESLEQYGARTVARVDFVTGRVKPAASLDVAGGVALAEGARRSLRLYADVRNLTNRFDVINFAGLFSGTALAPPRSAGVRLTASF